MFPSSHSYSQYLSFSHFLTCPLFLLLVVFFFVFISLTLSFCFSVFLFLFLLFLFSSSSASILFVLFYLSLFLCLFSLIFTSRTYLDHDFHCLCYHLHPICLAFCFHLLFFNFQLLPSTFLLPFVFSVEFSFSSVSDSFFSLPPVFLFRIQQHIEPRVSISRYSVQLLLHTRFIQFIEKISETVQMCLVKVQARILGGGVIVGREGGKKMSMCKRILRTFLPPSHLPPTKWSSGSAPESECLSLLIFTLNWPNSKEFLIVVEVSYGNCHKILSTGFNNPRNTVDKKSTLASTFQIHHFVETILRLNLKYNSTQVELPRSTSTFEQNYSLTSMHNSILKWMSTWSDFYIEFYIELNHNVLSKN